MERDPSVEALIHDGKQAYSTRRYKQAAKCFTLALKRCPCAKGLKRERCPCKNFTHAAENNVSIFHEALNTCSCSIGKTFDNCDNPLHIQALDYRAATFEALDALDRARKDAEWMLEIAPRCPDGYLRLGKISRLERRNEFAWKVFNAGIEAGVSAGINKTDPKMKKLYDARQPLHARYFRQDPLQLPLELVHHIFSYLGFADRLACLRVCKPWRRGLTSPENRQLWRSFEYRRRKRGSATANRGVKKYIGWSGNDVRRILIEDEPYVLELEQWLEMLMRGAPKLAHFALHISNRWNSSPSASLMRKRCAIKLPNREWLTHLELGNLPRVRLGGLWPNLRCLSLSSDVPAAWDPEPSITLPRLEQLRLGGECSKELAHDHPSIQNALLGPRLKVLIVQSDLRQQVTWPAARFVSSLCSNNSGNDLVHVDVTGLLYSLEKLALDRNWPTPQHHDIWIDQPPGSIESAPPNTFASLRALRLNGVPSNPEAAQTILKTAFEKGILTAFDLNFDRITLHRAGTDHFTYLKKYDWLKGAASIRNIGIRHFLFKMYSDEQEQALFDFLGSFPNLGTLQIESGHYLPSQLGLMIAEIMKRAKALKIVYAPGLTGAALDSVRAEAHAVHGIKIVPAEEPKEWPVPIYEE